MGVDVGPPRGTEKDFGPNTGTYVGAPLRRLDLRAIARHVARVLVLSMAMYLPMLVIGPYTVSVLSIGTAMALLGAAMPIATLQMMARPEARGRRLRHLHALWKAMNVVAAMGIAGIIAASFARGAPAPILAIMTGATIYAMHQLAKAILRGRKAPHGQ